LSCVLIQKCSRFYIRIMLKTLISIGLSILVFTGGLHVDLHDHTPADGYGICKVDCDDENHHASNHQCEKCIPKSSKLTNPNSGDLTHHQFTNSFYCLSKSIKKSFFNYSLFSRPPPIFI